jgi:hypothetical protein
MIALKTFMFSHESTDAPDIGIPSGAATSAAVSTGRSTGQTGETQ